MKLFDDPWYDRLMREFERSTRALLLDLCDQLDEQHAGLLTCAYFATIRNEF